MFLLRKRDIQLAKWFLVAVFVADLTAALFWDLSKVPGIAMQAAFVFVLLGGARIADRRKGAED
ncbi:hypothetical protein [Pseudomonas syringae]